MDLMRNVTIVCGSALVLMIVLGQILLPLGHTTEIDVEYDGSINFTIDTDYSTYYSAVSLDNGDVPPSSRYIALFDDGHEWFVSDSYIDNALSHLEKSMSDAGLDMEIMETDDVRDVMNGGPEHGQGVTTIIFMTGSLPSELYDGTEDCLLIEWLEKGGNIVWANGPIGKYVSTSVECVDIGDRSSLLFGVEGAVKDSDGACFDTGLYTDSISDLLRVYYSECTNGIEMGLQEDQLTLDYQVDGYGATTLMRYWDGTGMLTVFGGAVDHHYVPYVTQILLSGITYDTVVIDHVTGIGDHASGTLIAGDRPTAFITLGMISDYISKVYRFEQAS